jgi:hypothetical protein
MEAVSIGLITDMGSALASLSGGPVQSWAAPDPPVAPRSAGRCAQRVQ